MIKIFKTREEAISFEKPECSNMGDKAICLFNNHSHQSIHKIKSRHTFYPSEFYNGSVSL